MRVREMEIGEVQERFANLVWDNEPIPSGQLVKLCEQVFQWKKPTTYTVLRKLCEKGLFQNVNGVVSSVMSREEFAYAAKLAKETEFLELAALPEFQDCYVDCLTFEEEEA